MFSQEKVSNSCRIKWVFKEMTRSNLLQHDVGHRLFSNFFSIPFGSIKNEWRLISFYNNDTDSIGFILDKKKLTRDDFIVECHARLNRHEIKFNVHSSEILPGYGWGWSSFLDLDTLFDPLKNCVNSEGQMELDVLLTLFEAPDGLNESFNVKKANSNTLMYNEKFCDFTLKCNDGIGILVHRVILANNSSVFNDLFTSAKNENKSFIDIKDISSITMKAVLDFIYTGCADLTNAEHETITNVLNVADLYKLDILKSKCAEKLTEHIDSLKAINLLSIATQQGIATKEFEQKCLASILLNYDWLKTTDEWKAMKKPVFIKIMEAFSKMQFLLFETVL